MIGKLDLAVALGIGERPVAVVRDAIELHEPMFEPAPYLDLPGAKFVRFGIPRQDRLGGR